MDTSKEKIFEYLIVDDYFETFIGINALATAFRLNIIDYLINKQKCTINDISKEFSIKENGLKVLLDILLSYEIVLIKNNFFFLSDKFKRALKYRDLLETKLRYTRLVSLDILKNFPQIIKEDYSLLRWEIMKFWYSTTKNHYSKEELSKVEQWVNFMSIMTKYDSLGCIYNFDFGAYNNILDIGGNSGEFALQICKHFEYIKISIFDLPIICEIGRKHLDNFKQKNRINFIKGNLCTDDIPKKFDLIMFKSFLHDWPIERVILFIKKVYDALEKGGKILIYELEMFDVQNNKLLDIHIMWLTFLPYFKKPSEYQKILKTIGFRDINLVKIKNTNFFILIAQK